MSAARPIALLVTHGGLGQELIRTAEAILGGQTGAIAISNTGRSSDALTEAIDAEILALPKGTPVVILADLAAGSCGMASRRAGAHAHGVRRITGVNLPMLLEFFHYRDALPLDELIPRLELKGKAGIVTF